MKSFGTPLAIIIATIVLVIGAKYIGQSIWPVLTAIGTIGVVLWAIFQQGILTWWQRPKLQIMPSEWKPPYFRSAPEVNRNTGESVGLGYYVTITLKNMGETIAKNCQPLLTAMGRINADKWQKEENWLPLSLRWTLDELSERTAGKPTAERDLVPHRPYQFSLGHVSTADPDNFTLAVIIRPTGQQTVFPPGEYCFEINVFAERIRPISKYFFLQWDGGCTDHPEEVKKNLRVFAKDHPPWPIR